MIILPRLSARTCLQFGLNNGIPEIGYRDPPLSDSISRQILPELFGYREPISCLDIRTGVKKLSDRKLMQGFECPNMESLKT